MPSELTRRVTNLAARQHGLATFDQLRGLGATPHQLRRWVVTGWLGRPGRAMYCIRGAPITWHSHVLSHVLASGGLASHRTAACLWSLEGFRPGAVELTIANGRNYRHDGVRTHRSTDLSLAAATVRDGIAVTGLRRTLVDLGAVVGVDRVGAAVDAARERYGVTWEELLRTLLSHARRGRDGVGPFRAVLDAHYGELAVPDSRFERLVERLLLDAGLPTPVLQHEVHDAAGRFVARIDLAYPDQAIAVELDGAVHRERQVWERDRPRQNQLELLGWLVLRYTWAGFRESPMQICIDVARALQARPVASVARE